MAQPCIDVSVQEGSIDIDVLKGGIKLPTLQKAG
jgi:hypothetical protein